MRSLIIAALIALGACASNGAQTASAEPRDCFRPNDIITQRAIDDRNFRVRTRTHGDYVVTVASDAYAVNVPTPIVVETTTGFICAGNGSGVLIHAGEAPQHTLIIQQIARAEAAAPTGS